MAEKTKGRKDGRTKYLVYAATALALAAIVFFVLGGNAGQQAGQYANTTQTEAPTASPEAPAPNITSAKICADGAQKELACVGEMSGIQTYYECIDGSWVSASRYNESCATVKGPVNPWEVNGTSNATGANATPALVLANATA